MPHPPHPHGARVTRPAWSASLEDAMPWWCVVIGVWLVVSLILAVVVWRAGAVLGAKDDLP